MQKAIFPMKVLNISQGINGKLSHRGTMNVDICGKDGSIEPLYAPFDCIVKAISKTNTVYIESLTPVKYADGTEDYMNCMFAHDNDIKNLSVGQIIKQGEHFYDEGTFGYANGNHVHMACSRGKYVGGFFNSYKKWCLKNQIEPYKALFIMNDTIIKKGIYKWIKTDTTAYEPIPQYKTYLIKRGDTLTKISKKYGISIAILKSFNGLKTDKIIAGRTLRIPNKEVK